MPVEIYLRLLKAYCILRTFTDVKKTIHYSDIFETCMKQKSLRHNKIFAGLSQKRCSGGNKAHCTHSEELKGILLEYFHFLLIYTSTTSQRLRVYFTLNYIKLLVTLQNQINKL